MVARGEHRGGFTIVELLIVVVVIAILAAITIISYNGITSRAYDATVKSDLEGMMKTLELWKVDNGGYPDPAANTTHNLQDVKLRATKSSYAVDPTTVNNLVYCYDSTDRTRTYAIVALSKSGHAFYISPLYGSVQTFSDSWGAAAGEDIGICTSLGDNLSNSFRGYASNDTTTGPWRPWVGGS